MPNLGGEIDIIVEEQELLKGLMGYEWLNVKHHG